MRRRWGFAHGFAKLVTGEGISEQRAAAGRALIEACMTAPWEMSGTERACLQLMQAAPGRLFVKTGAEGVFCGALPDLGLGFALKIDDGATRASETLVAAVIAAALQERNPGTGTGVRAAGAQDAAQLAQDRGWRDPRPAGLNGVRRFA